MRLKRYINEIRKKKPVISDEEFSKITETLDRNCKKIISIYKQADGFLWRGINSSEMFLEKKGRTGVRIPKHTWIEIHRHLNKLYKDKFGWKVRDGLPVTTSISQSVYYGTPYIFFPAGSAWKYCYSPDIDDLWKIPAISTPPIGVDMKDYLEMKKRTWSKYLNKYTDRGIEKVIGSTKEIEAFFKVGKYYLVHKDLWDNLSEYYGITGRR